MEINCNECKSLLFKTDSKDMVLVGIEALGKGFVYKNAILFTGTDTKLFFCNEDCKKSYYDINIPKNKDIDNVLKEMRKEIPDMAKQVCSRMDSLVKSLNKKR